MRNLEIGLGLFPHDHVSAVFERANFGVRQFVRHTPADTGVVTPGHDQCRLRDLVQVRDAVPIFHRAGVAELVEALERDEGRRIEAEDGTVEGVRPGLQASTRNGN